MNETVSIQELSKEVSVLSGPPGLLIGLTLLIFVFARLYLGWSMTQEPAGGAMAEDGSRAKVIMAHPETADISPAHRYRFVSP